jgi:hypothetical protein
LKKRTKQGFEFSTSQNAKQNKKYIKSIKKNMREEKSNLNLTPHTTVFHQFPIEAMVGPGIRTGIEKIFSLSGSNSFNVFLYSIFQPFYMRYQAASVNFMPAIPCCPPYPCPKPRSL